ncbi:MAG: hypothetical protein ACPGLV_16000, partial [Bacteroidia bacterium]
MKNNLLAAILIVLFPSWLNGQNEVEVNKEVAIRKDDFRKYINKELFALKDTGEIVHPRVLNEVFEQRITSNFTNISSLAPFRSYAVLNSEDDRLFIGGSTEQRNKNEQVVSILTGGLESDISDGFSTLFSDNSLNENLGFKAKANFLFNGTLGVGKKSQKQKIEESRDETDELSNKRQLLIEELTFLATEELCQELFKTLMIQDIKKNKAEELDEPFEIDKDKIYEIIKSKIRNKYVLEYYKKLAETINSDRLFSHQRKNWFTLEAYVPITKSEYQFRSSFSADNETVTYMPYEFDALFEGFVDGNCGALFYGVSLGVTRTDVVKSEIVKQHTFNDYVNSGGNDTLLLRQLESNDIYVGDFRTFWSPKLGARLAYYPFQCLGFSFSVERYGGHENWQGINWIIGVP